MDKRLMVGICVVSYNHFLFTKRCVESIIKNTPRDLYKLCLIDNGSIDKTKGWAYNLLDKRFLHRFIDNDKNEGACKAANQGKIWSLNEDTDATVIMANDHLMTEGWLEPLINSPADHSNPFVFFSTPNMRKLDNDIGKVLDRYRGLRVFYLQEDDEANIDRVLKETYGNFENFVWRFKKRHKDKPYFKFDSTDWTGLVFYRNYVIEKVGLKDEEFLKYDKASHADIDYKNRVKNCGFSFVIAMQSYVHHWGSITTRKMGLKSDVFYKAQENNAERYYRIKWGG